MPKKALAVDDDGLGGDTPEEHNAKRGRWGQELLSVIRKAEFMYLVGLVDKTKDPLTHFYRVMMPSKTKKQQHAHKMQTMHKSVMSWLVCGKAESILLESENSLTTDAWDLTIACEAPPSLVEDFIVYIYIY